MNVGSAEGVETGLVDRVAVLVELPQARRSAAVQLAVRGVEEPEAGCDGAAVPRRPVRRICGYLLQVLSRVVLCFVAVQLEEGVTCAPHRAFLLPNVLQTHA